MQIVRLFGVLPNMLELTANPCVQGCSYCYAKNWKKEVKSVDRVVNKILREEQKKEGMLPFLIRKRSPVTISNRSDLMSCKNWRDYLIALKKMGFPIYLESKLNKEYKDIRDILDPKTDYIYQTITGYTKEYEEDNILSPKEKIKAGQYFSESGFTYCLAINPFIPTKITIQEVKKLLQEIKPDHFVFRPYHTTSIQKDKKYFLKEFPKEENRMAMFEMMDYCDEKGIINDINDRELSLKQNSTLNAQIDTNDKIYGGNSFVFQKILEPLYSQFENKKAEGIELHFKDILSLYKKEIKYFGKCVFTKRCYTSRYFNIPEEKFKIDDFLRYLWNGRKFNIILDYLKDKVDDDGNLIYVRYKNDLR